jgi:hypothetical protein
VTPGDRFVPLMILTEGSREAANIDDAAAREMVIYCLGLGSDWWADKAIDWVDHGVSGTGVIESLAAAAQQVRLHTGLRPTLMCHD